jgi:hypothetical protein
MAAIGAEQLDFLVPELLPMAIELPLAFWTGPKIFATILLYLKDKIRNSNIEIRNKLESN